MQQKFHKNPSPQNRTQRKICEHTTTKCIHVYALYAHVSTQIFTKFMLQALYYLINLGAVHL